MTESLATRLHRNAYPRSNSYDPAWALDNLMGPSALWLTEAMTNHLDLRSGQHVLDLGCGRAVSSIFLAKEFGVRVTAADLWIQPTENGERIREAGLESLITPIHAEGHALPFADETFDTIIAIDSYQYLGTDDLYAAQIARCLKPGGILAIAVPIVFAELTGDPPAHLIDHWLPDYWCFHSLAWWSRQFHRSGAFTVEHAAPIPDFPTDWLAWCHTAREFDYRYWQEEIDLLEADGGHTVSFGTLTARKLPTPD
jgi:SAM-dependent methyltransferase